jgi:hypothetical protein
MGSLYNIMELGFLRIDRSIKRSTIACLERLLLSTLSLWRDLEALFGRV